jgi:hypothetical protein
MSRRPRNKTTKDAATEHEVSGRLRNKLVSYSVADSFFHPCFSDTCPDLQLLAQRDTTPTWSDSARLWLNQELDFRNR